MAINTRRNFFGRIAAMTAVVTGASKLLAQQAPPAGATGDAAAGADAPRRPSGSNHVHDGIY